MRQVPTGGDMDRPMPERAQARADDQTGQSTLQLSLRPVRVVLSGAFLALILASGGSGALSLSGGSRVFFVAAAAANIVVNAVLILRRVPASDGRRLASAQLVVDALLALMGVLILDSGAAPLAWVVLLLPVLDAGVAFGGVAAGAVWGTLSLVYIAFKLQIEPQSQSEALRLAIQQLAAVAAVAIPAGFVAGRLRDDVDRARAARIATEHRAHQLLLVAGAARELNATTDALRVLDIFLGHAGSLGFARVEVCEKVREGAWRFLRVSGSAGTKNPRDDRSLDEVIATRAANTLGIGGDPREARALHELGYRAAVAVPLWQDAGYALAIRAWSAVSLAPDASSLEALELLAAQTTGAWRNAVTLSDLEAWSTRLEHEATHDALTGLPNRTHLLTSLELALISLRTTGEELAVLFLDLDGFKEINDRLGHEAGDSALQALAERLQRLVRPGDIIARLGGDEFVVLVRDFGEAENVHRIAARMCDVVTSPLSIAGTETELGASIGIAFPRPEELVDDILRASDRAMYEAKKLGGNRFAVSGRDPPAAMV